MTNEAEPEVTRRPIWPWVLAAVIAGVGLALVMINWLRPHVFAGGVIEASSPVPAMEGLVYTDGTEVDVEQFHDDVLLVYFGYTHCPDLCPTTLATVARTLEQLGDRSEDVHMLMVTVDPSRDTPETLEEYVAFFDPTFRGVWGDEDQVRNVAALYGVHFEYAEADEDGFYDVGHTSTLFAIDREGYPRLVYGVGVSPEDLSADLRELLS